MVDSFVLALKAALVGFLFATPFVALFTYLYYVIYAAT